MENITRISDLPDATATVMQNSFNPSVQQPNGEKWQLYAGQPRRFSPKG
jgi:hypothetical protein